MQLIALSTPHVRLRRGVRAVAVAGAVTLAVALTPGAQGAGNTRSASASGWLAGELSGGLLHNDAYNFDDIGLTLDAYFALHTAKARPRVQTRIIGSVEPVTPSYVGGYGEKYAGPTGKLALAVKGSGRSPRDYGGLNLIARLRSLIDTSGGPGTGRASDVSTYGDYSNTISQTYVVRALGAVGSPLIDQTTAYLLKQQCPRGFFRSKEKDVPCARGLRSVDATAFAVLALRAAQRHGVTGLAQPFARAVTWLMSAEHADGSFVEQGVANANSTGLAALALHRVSKGLAANAAGWLTRHQVTRRVAERHPALAGEVGAIAFDDSAMRDAKRQGITDAVADQWRRATTQGALGLPSLLPRTTLGVWVSGDPAPGERVLVRGSGLVFGEHWTLKVAGVRVDGGRADETGSFRRWVQLPEGVSRVRIVVLGSWAGRVGSRTLHLS